MKSYAQLGRKPEKGDRVIDLCGVWPAMTVLWSGDKVGLKTDDWQSMCDGDRCSTSLVLRSAMHTLAPTRSHEPVRRQGMTLDTHGNEGTKTADRIPMPPPKKACSCGTCKYDSNEWVRVGEAALYVKCKFGNRCPECGDLLSAQGWAVKPKHRPLRVIMGGDIVEGEDVYTEPWEKTCPKCKYVIDGDGKGGFAGMTHCTKPQHREPHSERYTMCCTRNVEHSRCPHWTKKG